MNNIYGVPFEWIYGYNAEIEVTNVTDGVSAMKVYVVVVIDDDCEEKYRYVEGVFQSRKDAKLAADECTRNGDRALIVVEKLVKK